MTAQTQHPHRPSIRRAGRALLLALIAFAALCAGAAPASAREECKVVLYGKDSDGIEHLIRIHRSDNKVGTSLTFTQPGFGDHFVRASGRRFGQFDDWNNDDWNDEIERVAFFGDCGDAEVWLYEHKEWGGWAYPLHADNPVIPENKKEEASSVVVIFHDGLREFQADYNIYNLQLHEYIARWMSLRPDFETTWTQIPAGVGALDIGAGGGAVWMVGSDHRVYRMTADASGWEYMGLSEAARIDVSNDGRGVVAKQSHRNNEIWQYIPASNSWEQIMGSAIDIGFGANGSLWAIAFDPLYRVLRWNHQGYWDDMGGEATRIDVAPNGTAYIVQDDPNYFGIHTGTIWQYGGGGPGDWHLTSVDLRATDIALGISPHGAAWGAIWAIGPGNQIYRWSDAGNGFEKTNGGSMAITADGNGNVLSVEQYAGTIWQGDSPDSQ